MIVKISLRNLIRQKRRNFLLGLGIAFGMAILVFANGFSSGMSDVLLNKLIIWITGHIRVTMAEKDELRWDIIRDQERVQAAIRATIPGDITIFEDVTTGGRALGKGASGSVTLKGLEMDSGFFKELQMEAGNAQDIMNPNIANPVIIYSMLADEIHIGLGDVIPIQFQTAYRQMEMARFTVVAVIKGDMPFIGTSIYVHLNTLKPLLGYKPHETGALNIMFNNLDNPRMVTDMAQRLHDALQPGLAGYHGIVSGNGQDVPAQVVAVSADPALRDKFSSQVQVTAGSLPDALANKDAAIISQELAQTLGLSVGSSLTATYETKFEGQAPTRAYQVGAIVATTPATPKDLVFLPARAFDVTVIPQLPQTGVTLNAQSPLSATLVKEWNVLPRTATAEALQTKYDELEYQDWHGAFVDVQTMYELASAVLSLEFVLDIVTWAMVCVLFFIIVIGVVNTLRMTIRERTREIGTVRAIGMQAGDVRWSFLLEVLLLALFAGLIGIACGLLAMFAVGLITIQGYGIFNLILVNNHLHFVPTFSDVAQNLLIILGIAFLTALLPANRAARMSVSAALRHYE